MKKSNKVFFSYCFYVIKQVVKFFALNLTQIEKTDFEEIRKKSILKLHFLRPNSFVWKQL